MNNVDNRPHGKPALEEIASRMSLGERIFFLRRQAKMTQEQLADRLNVERSLISVYEADKSSPRPDTLKKLAMIFGLTPNDLLHGLYEEAEIRNIEMLADAQLFRHGVRIVLDRPLSAPGSLSVGSQGLLIREPDADPTVLWDEDDRITPLPDSESCHVVETDEEFRISLAHHRETQECELRARCPRCGEWIFRPSRQALSRRADVYVCDSCGTVEALEDFYAATKKEAVTVRPLGDWWLVRRWRGRS